jgi:hypothetical protein
MASPAAVVFPATITAVVNGDRFVIPVASADLTVRWLAATAAERASSGGVRLPPASVAIEATGELLAPTLKLGDLLRGVFHPPQPGAGAPAPAPAPAPSSSSSSSSSSPTPDGKPRLTFSLPAHALPPVAVEVVLAQPGGLVAASLRDVRLPDSGLRRTMWQAAAFSASATGQRAVAASLAAAGRERAEQEAVEGIERALLQAGRLTNALARFTAVVHEAGDASDPEAADEAAREALAVMQAPWPWLRLGQVMGAGDPKEMWKIRTLLPLYFSDSARIFARFGTRFGGGLDVGSDDPAASTTMQLHEWLHFCQAAGMFPLPITLGFAEDTFNKACIRISVGAPGEGQAGGAGAGAGAGSHLYGLDTGPGPVARFLTLPGFMEAMVFLADVAFGQEIHGSHRTGPGKGLERFFTNYVTPLSARLPAGSARRMLHERSCRTWLRGRRAHALRSVQAYYSSLVDENAAAAIKRRVDAEHKAAGGQPPSDDPDAIGSIQRERRTLRLQEFTALLVHAGIAPPYLLFPPDKQPKDAAGAAGKGQLTALDVRKAYFSALALANREDAGLDMSGRPRDDDPYERMCTADELAEAVARAALYRWSPAAGLVLDADPDFDELDRVLARQAKARAQIAAGIERIVQLIAPKDSHGKGGGAAAAAAVAAAAVAAAAAAGGIPLTPRLTTPASPRSPIGVLKAARPRDTRRGSVVMEDIVSVSHGVTHHGPITQAPPVVAPLTAEEEAARPHMFASAAAAAAAVHLHNLSEARHAAIHAALDSPRATASSLMTALHKGDDAGQPPSKVEEMEIFSTFARWALDAVVGLAAAGRLGEGAPKALLQPDVSGLVRRLNIHAASITATLLARGGPSRDELYRPATVEIPGWDSLFIAPPGGEGGGSGEGEGGAGLGATTEAGAPRSSPPRGPGPFGSPRRGAASGSSPAARTSPQRRMSSSLGGGGGGGGGGGHAPPIAFVRHASSLNPYSVKRAINLKDEDEDDAFSGLASASAKAAAAAAATALTHHPHWMTTMSSSAYHHHLLVPDANHHVHAHAHAHAAHAAHAPAPAPAPAAASHGKGGGKGAASPPPAHAHGVAGHSREEHQLKLHSGAFQNHGHATGILLDEVAAMANMDASTGVSKRAVGAKHAFAFAL